MARRKPRYRTIGSYRIHDRGEGDPQPFRRLATDQLAASHHLSAVQLAPPIDRQWQVAGRQQRGPDVIEDQDPVAPQEGAHPAQHAKRLLRTIDVWKNPDGDRQRESLSDIE